MPIQYRAATPQDIDSLTALRQQMMLEGGKWDADALDRPVHNARAYFHTAFGDGTLTASVAECDGEVVGMGCASFFALPPNDWCPGGQTAYLSGVFVQPGHRGRGIATELLRLLMAAAHARGCERIWLHASDMGRPIYEKAGLTPSDDLMACFPFGTGPSIDSTPRAPA